MRVACVDGDDCNAGLVALGPRRCSDLRVWLGFVLVGSFHRAEEYRVLRRCRQFSSASSSLLELSATLQGSASKKRHASVFVRLRRDMLGSVLVVCNYDDKQPVTVEVALDDGDTLKRWRLVDDPAWHSASEIVIPPRSAAVIVPE